MRAANLALEGAAESGMSAEHKNSRRPSHADAVKADLAAGLSYFADFLELSLLDFSRSAKLLNEHSAKRGTGEFDEAEHQYWCRVMIRSTLAMIDGLCYLMRQLVVWACERGELSLSPAEKLFLREESGVFRKGRIETVEKNNRFFENLEVAFCYFPLLFGVEFRLNKSGRGWESFKKAVSTRDIITHPKSLSDLTLSSSDLSAVKERIRWFADICLNLFYKSRHAALLRGRSIGLNGDRIDSGYSSGDAL